MRLNRYNGALRGARAQQVRRRALLVLGGSGALERPDADLRDEPRRVRLAVLEIVE